MTFSPCDKQPIPAATKTRAAATERAVLVRLSRRDLCSLAVAGLAAPSLIGLRELEPSTRIIIRDGWILLEYDLD
jgi:hypothetical protein